MNGFDFNLVVSSCLSGDLKTFKAILEFQKDAENQLGLINLNKANNNQLLSNIIGATALWGHSELLEHLIDMYPSEINFKA